MSTPENAAEWLINEGLFAVTSLLVLLTFAAIACLYMMHAGKAAAHDDEPTRITIRG
jgi:hypothetical protein